MNLAGAWRLPVVFVCENNYYGVGTRLGDVSASESLVERAAAYGMPASSLDGNDVWRFARPPARRSNGRGTGRARRSSSAGRGAIAPTSKASSQSTGQEQERDEWLERDPLPSFAGS